MKSLKTKSEITAKKLHNNNFEFKGRKIGFDKNENLYFSGSLFHEWKDFFSTVKDLKNSF